MDIGPVLERLRTSAKLPVLSPEQMASEVHAKAKEARRESDSVTYLKAPSTVCVPSPLETSPADILRELGVATTFVSRSPFLPVAQLWAHVRYCATLRTVGGMLALTPDAAQSVVHHHKVAQSEQLGIGLALVVARAALQQLHPNMIFHVADADVALKAGYLKGVPGEVRNKPETKKRPDYFLVGFERGNPRSAVHVSVLECKGSHQEMREVTKQLADASLQVRTVAVGNQPLYGLMVASLLKHTGIRSYIFDPPGDDELWSGDPEDLQDLLSQRPRQQRWLPGRPVPGPAPTLDGDASGTGDQTSADDLGEEVLATPPPYQIPADQRRWFAGVLSATTAASMLAFAGNNASAVGYTTEGQRGEEQEPLDDFELWADTANARLRFPGGGPVLLGHTQRMPLGDGRTLTVFRGLEGRLYRQLADGNLDHYLRNAGWLRRWWMARRRRRPGDAFSVGDNGSALVIRIEND